jgi:DNA-binding response OmpR family regulator
LPTILCIDDDPKILELQANILQTSGYEVLSAADGPAGIALAMEHTVDAVVLDFMMPGMHGGQVAEVLLRERPAVPIVMCTGFFDAVPEWLRWFAAGVVQKGDGPGALLALLQGLIAAKKKSARASDGDQGTHRNHAA